MNILTKYVKFLRIPGLGGLAIPPVIGALTVNPNIDLFYLILLFLIGSLAAIYGFVLNDYVDIEVDKLSNELKGRPLVSGEISQKKAVGICIFCVFFAFLLIFILFYGKVIEGYILVAVISISLALILGSIYDFHSKDFIGSDILVSISVSLVFLFGALSIGEPTLFTWIIFILTFNNLLHMNAIEGGIKDAEHDKKYGVKNIALKSGVIVSNKNIIIPKKFKALSFGIRLFSSLLIFIPFLFYGISFYPWQIIILFIAILIMLYLNLKLLTIKEFNRNIIRKYISSLSFVRYSLIPIMLISTIGIIYSTILIIIPIGWYIIFAPLSGEKLLKPII
jgi:4-hydroxybenzoate polyprenyltransferase